MNPGNIQPQQGMTPMGGENGMGGSFNQMFPFKVPSLNGGPLGGNMPQPQANPATRPQPPQPGLATAGGIQQAQMKMGGVLDIEAQPQSTKRAWDGVSVPGHQEEGAGHYPENTGILQRTAHLLEKGAFAKCQENTFDRSGHSSEAVRYQGIIGQLTEKSALFALTKFAMPMGAAPAPQQGFAPMPDPAGAPSTAPQAVGGPGMPPAAPPPAVDPASGQPVGGSAQQGAAPGAPPPPAGPGELPPGGAPPGSPTMGGMTPPMGEPPPAPLPANPRMNPQRAWTGMDAHRNDQFAGLLGAGAEPSTGGPAELQGDVSNDLMAMGGKMAGDSQNHFWKELDQGGWLDWLKTAAQDNGENQYAMQRSDSGGSKGLSYNPGHDSKGLESWHSITFKGDKGKKPNPFMGKHASGDELAYKNYRAQGYSPAEADRLAGEGEVKATGRFMTRDELLAYTPKTAALRTLGEPVVETEKKKPWYSRLLESADTVLDAEKEAGFNHKDLDILQHFGMDRKANGKLRPKRKEELHRGTNQKIKTAGIAPVAEAIMQQPNLKPTGNNLPAPRRPDPPKASTVNSGFTPTNVTTKVAELTPFAQAFFAHCDLLELSEHQIKSAVDRAIEKFGSMVEGELVDGLEKRAGLPGWGTVKAVGQGIGNWAMRKAPTASKAVYRAAVPVTQRAGGAGQFAKNVLQDGRMGAALGGVGGAIEGYSGEDGSFGKALTHGAMGAVGGGLGWNKPLAQGVARFGGGLAQQGARMSRQSPMLGSVMRTAGQGTQAVNRFVHTGTQALQRPLEAGAKALWTGSPQSMRLGQLWRGTGATASGIGGRVGLGLAGVGGAIHAKNMAGDFLYDNVREGAQHGGLQAINEAAPHLQQMAYNTGHQFLGDHGMLDESGQASFAPAIGRTVSNYTDPIFSALGMDPKSLTTTQKMLMGGGAAMGGYGLATGNPYAMAGGAAMGIGGFSPQIIQALQSQGVQVPGIFQQGANWVGGPPTQRNEWETQQALN